MLKRATPTHKKTTTYNKTSCFLCFFALFHDRNLAKEKPNRDKRKQLSSKPFFLFSSLSFSFISSSSSSSSSASHLFFLYLFSFLAFFLAILRARKKARKETNRQQIMTRRKGPPKKEVGEETGNTRSDIIINKQKELNA